MRSRNGASKPPARPERRAPSVPFAQLGRLVVAGMDGLILQYVCDPPQARSREDLDALTEMLVSLALR